MIAIYERHSLQTRKERHGNGSERDCGAAGGGGGSSRKNAELAGGAGRRGDLADGRGGEDFGDRRAEPAGGGAGGEAGGGGTGAGRSKGRECAHGVKSAAQDGARGHLRDAGQAWDRRS